MTDEMQELHRLMDNHDWFYEFSEDHSVWSRGRKEKEEITRLARQIGDQGIKALAEYSAKVYAGGAL